MRAKPHYLCPGLLQTFQFACGVSAFGSDDDEEPLRFSTLGFAEVVLV
jgi:hypothetical protein